MRIIAINNVTGVLVFAIVDSCFVRKMTRLKENRYVCCEMGIPKKILL